MQDKKKRLLWTVLAVILPGPWTPFIVLAYVLDRNTDHDVPAQHPPWPPPNPDGHGPVSPTLDPYANPPR